MWNVESGEELTPAQEWDQFWDDQQTIDAHIAWCTADGFCAMCQCM